MRRPGRLGLAGRGPRETPPATPAETPPPLLPPRRLRAGARHATMRGERLLAAARRPAGARRRRGRGRAEGREVPDLALRATGVEAADRGGRRRAAAASAHRPGQRALGRLRLSDDRHAGMALPDGWDDIPGARGCTPQSCAYRDALADFEELGATRGRHQRPDARRTGGVRGARAHPVPAAERRGPDPARGCSACPPSRPRAARSTGASPSSPRRGGSSRSSIPSSRPTGTPPRCSAGCASGSPRRKPPDERARRDDRDPGGGAAPRPRPRPGRGGRAARGRRADLAGRDRDQRARRLPRRRDARDRRPRRPRLLGGRVRRGGTAPRCRRRGRRHHPHRPRPLSARRVREEALAAGARVVSITGEGKGWPEAIEAAPPERSETYTASYLAALLVLARLTVALGGAEWSAEELAALPGLVEGAGAEPLPVEAPPPRLTVLFGAGPAAITAREGALKLREASRVLAEGFESEYLLHGSAVPLDRRRPPDRGRPRRATRPASPRPSPCRRAGGHHRRPPRPARRPPPAPRPDPADRPPPGPRLPLGRPPRRRPRPRHPRRLGRRATLARGAEIR